MAERKECLLIVDVQKGFINEHTKHLPGKINNLYKSYDKVFATKFYNKLGSFYDTLINWGRVRKATEEFELAFIPEERTEILEKSVYSCVNPFFLEKLNALGIKKVDICGIDTDICVTKCAVDLFENGIVPVVLEEYCASTAGPNAHKCGIATIKRFIGAKQVI